MVRHCAMLPLPGNGLLANRERGFALDDGKVVPPIIDCLRWQLVAALDHADMFAQNIALRRVAPKACFQHDDQSVGIDTQAHRPVGK